MRRQYFSASIIDNRQYTDLTFIHQRTGDKIHAPALIGLVGHLQGLFDSSW